MKSIDTLTNRHSGPSRMLPYVSKLLLIMSKHGKCTLLAISLTHEPHNHKAFSVYKHSESGEIRVLTSYTSSPHVHDANTCQSAVSVYLKIIALDD